MSRSSVAPSAHPRPPLTALLRRYGAGEPLHWTPVAEGLLNRGYRLRTTRGQYFLKHHLDGSPEALSHRHGAIGLLRELGLPVAPPLPARDGSTVTVHQGDCWALHPWVKGAHRNGAQLTPGECGTLGQLLGLVHRGLERVMATLRPVERLGERLGERPGHQGEGHPSADPTDTFALIDRLLHRVHLHRPYDAFDELARHRLLERRTLLEQHTDRRPPPGAATGWVHGDFHPYNLLYRGGRPAAIIDWDRLAVQPRAEEAVRAAVIFFVRPGGTLDLPKVRAYARAYREAAGAGPQTLTAAVHRVWWERLNDFWMLRWRYQREDHRADPQFPAAAALAVWWTREYGAVRDAFAE